MFFLAHSVFADQGKSLRTNNLLFRWNIRMKSHIWNIFLSSFISFLSFQNFSFPSSLEKCPKDLTNHNNYEYCSLITILTFSTLPFIGGFSFVTFTSRLFNPSSCFFNSLTILCPTCSINLERMAI